MGMLKKLLGRNHPPASAVRLGRNERCWCGSGDKYKRCHYESDLKYFARSYGLGGKSSAAGAA